MTFPDHRESESDSDREDNRSTSFLPTSTRAPAQIRRRPPAPNALPRSSSFRKPREESKGGKRSIRRGVSFRAEHQLVRVVSVKSLLGNDKKAASELWYDEIELETSKTESYALVEQSETPHAPKLCEETETLRGLESKTEEGSMTAFMNRVNAIGAVLDHQGSRNKNALSSDSSLNSSVTDDEELASLASQATEDAKRLAHERALQDEREAWEYLYGPGGRPPSSSKSMEFSADNYQSPKRLEEQVSSTLTKPTTTQSSETLSKAPETNKTAEESTASSNLSVFEKEPKKKSTDRPGPKREGSLRIPVAFASTNDNAVPSWGKINAAQKKRLPPGRSKSFTLAQTASSLLVSSESKNNSLIDYNDEKDDNEMLLSQPSTPRLPPSASGKIYGRQAPQRIGRLQRAANKSLAANGGAASDDDDCHTCHTTGGRKAVIRATTKKVGRSKSLIVETAATWIFQLSW